MKKTFTLENEKDLKKYIKLAKVEIKKWQEFLKVAEKRLEMLDDTKNGIVHFD